MGARHSRKNELVEKEKRNRNSLILAVALLVIFGIVVLNVMRIESARRQELNQMAEANMDESMRNKEIGRVLHDRIASVIAEDVGSIVCLGDGFMGKAFPESLDKVMQEEVIGDINEEITTRANLYGLSHLQMPIFDASTANEKLNGILARNSLISIRLAETISIPGDLEAVTISLVDGENQELLFKNDIHLTINEIEGIVSNSMGDEMVFTRTSPGDSVTMEAGTEAFADPVDSFQGSKLVLLLGESYAVSVEELIEVERKLINGYRSSEFVVIGITDKGSELDIAMQNAFGNSYLRFERNIYKADEAARQVYMMMDKKDCFSSVRKAIEDARVELDAMK